MRSQASSRNSQAQHAWKREPPLRSFIIPDNAAVIGTALPLQHSHCLKTYFASDDVWSGFYYTSLWAQQSWLLLSGFLIPSPRAPWIRFRLTSLPWLRAWPQQDRPEIIWGLISSSDRIPVPFPLSLQTFPDPAPDQYFASSNLTMSSSSRAVLHGQSHCNHGDKITQLEWSFQQVVRGGVGVDTAKDDSQQPLVGVRLWLDSFARLCPLSTHPSFNICQI